MRKIRELVDPASSDRQEKSYFTLRYNEVGKEIEAKKKRETTQDRYYVLMGSFYVTENEINPASPASETQWRLEADPTYFESGENAHFAACDFIADLVAKNIENQAERRATQKTWEDQLRSHGDLHAMIKNENGTWHHFISLCVMPDNDGLEDDDAVIADEDDTD
jgi:hypothetical protein